MAKLISYAVKTDQGPYLQVNEDDQDIDLVNNLFLIFDGFGGSGIGDRCVAKLKETIKKFYVKIAIDPDSTLPFFFSYKYLIEGNFLVNSMHCAHSLLKKDNQDKDMSQRDGASMIGAALAENILTFASVGNCSSYLYRKGGLSRIVHPDGMQSLATDIHMPYFSTAPTSAFGLFDDLHLQVHEQRILKGDLIVMMTDGAYARIKDEELKFIIEKQGTLLPQKIKEVMDLANARGNLDNQTTIFLQF